MKNIWLKRLGIVFGIFLGLFVAAAIIVPLVVNVDSYRPQIVAKAGEYINGKLELGKLSLSMWGKIKVGVDGVTLSDDKGRKVVDAKDVYVHIPWLSLLTFAPQVNFTMNNPSVLVVKEKNGKLNVLTLVKSDAAKPGETTPSAPETAPAPQDPKQRTEIPAIAQRARLGVVMTRANLTYQDLKSDLNAQVKDLNVKLKDVSLSHSTEAEISAMVDTKMGKTMTVRGPVTLTATGEPQSKDGIRSARVTFKCDLDSLEIVMPELLEKKKGIVANAQGIANVGQDGLSFENLAVNFFNAEVKVSGGVTGFQNEQAAPAINLKFASNPIALKAWSEIVPMLKAYELGGTAKLEGEAGGTTEAPTYRALATVDALTAKAPNLKAQPKIDAKVSVVTDQIDNFSLIMTAPQNHLAVSGKVVSFTKPKVDIAITSKGMDLDSLIDFPKPAEKKGGAGAPADTTASAPAGKEAKGADFDKLVDPLRDNEVARNMVANVRAKIDSLKVYNAKMTNLSTIMTFKGLATNMETTMGLWNGNVKVVSNMALAPKTPTYTVAVRLNSLDLNQAVSSQMELFKNTVRGVMTLAMDGKGASFNPEPAKKNLVTKGGVRIEKAQFATMDIGKMATEAINKEINNIPQLKGKGIKPPNNVESKYESVTADFTIENELFRAPNFYAKAIPNQGIDVTGDTAVGIVSYGLQANWTITDTYNLLKLKDVTVDIAGTPVPAILAENGQVVKFPIRVGGTIFSPQFNYTTVPEFLAKVAVSNIGKAAENRLKAEVQKKAQETANKALQDIGKKIFGR